MDDQDLASALRERMTTATEGITPSRDLLGNVHQADARRRRRQNWAIAGGAVVAAVAVSVPTTLAMDNDAPAPSAISTTTPSQQPVVPGWTRRCFEDQQERSRGYLQPAPEYVGLTVKAAWRLAGKHFLGVFIAWNGRCADGVAGHGTMKVVYLAIVGPTAKEGGPVLTDRVVAAWVENP